MTQTVEDDFREFVAARWTDLEGVAFVVTLDAATARRVTSEALAVLHRGWRDALDEGRPVLHARRAALGAAVEAATAGGGTSAPADPDHPGDEWDDADHHDPMVVTLVDALRGSSPVERALAGASCLWGSGPDEVADLLGMPPARLRDADAALRRRLLQAHTDARAADGLEPAAWALDDDVAVAVEHLLRELGAPPDPTALVDDRRRSVRRRSVLTGATVVAAVGAAGWWVVLDDRAAPAAGSSGAGSGRTTPPPPDDRTWLSVSTWSPRGTLANDARVQALVIARSAGAARLLWAEDVGEHRLVVTATAASPGSPELLVQVWRGSAGVDPGSMTEIELVDPVLPEGRDVVAIALPTYPGTQFLVLARPPVTLAAYSSTVRPAADGTIARTWQPISMAAGIGVVLSAEQPGPALRVLCAGLDGPPAGVVHTAVGRLGRDPLAGFAEETRRFVAAATGQSLDDVRTEVVTDAKVGGSVLDPDAFSAQGGDGRVVVLRTTTADDAVVRSVRVLDDGRSSLSFLDAEPPTVLPADTPRDEPVVVRLDDARPAVGRFLVVAPGAARVQLLSTSPNAYPVSRVTETRGGVAVVEVINADSAAGFRLVRRDGTGRRFGTGVPQAGADLLDLRPAEQTLEG